MNWDGSIETWDRDQNTFGYFTRSREYRGELVPTNNLVQFLWVTPERLTYVFRNPNSSPHVMDGRLLEIRDFNGNSVKVNWDQNVGVITQIVDSVRGVYSLKYNPQNLLSNVTFGQWQVNFTYATNRLISKTLTNSSGAYTNVNTTWQFRYGTNGLLASIVDPRGNTNVTVQYDQYGRQSNQIDALGRATATRYGVPGNRQITRIDPATNSWIETYDRKGHILAQQDPLGNVTGYAYDTNGNRISITEPLGWTTLFGYDDRANVTARTNALGEVTRWVFHDFFNKAIQQITPQPADANGWTSWTNYYAYDAGGNLISHSDALGALLNQSNGLQALVTYAYSANGLVLASTDANGHTTQYGYDTNGFLNSRTDPASNTWQFTLNDVGWRLSETTPLGDSTSFAYDLNGNTVRIVDPLNRPFIKNYDPNGNLVAQSDGKGQFTRYAYDIGNQRVAMTNRAGSVWLYSFTSRGKPDRVTDPLGNVITNSYDSANRLVAVSDPLGNTLTNQYDANGNLVALSDPLGQRWTKTFDRLKRVISETDPLGNSKQTRYDEAGRIAQLITPKGFASLHFYDGRGRLTRWVEPETWQGKPITWFYDYDGVGNITNITDALGGHYLMSYGSRNERLSEINQDLFTWQYTYDKLLRLKTQQDPNGILRTREYDPVNRLTRISLSTGRADTYDYDDNDNPRTVSRKLADVAVATTGLTYDSLDRVTSVTDPNGQPVGYGFDALSRIVTLTYPGSRTLTNSYDAVGRLTNQMDWAGRQTSYSYDRAGRLLQRTYPNGVTQANTFDTAGRIASIQYQASGASNATLIHIALAYAYDRNGNKIGGSERGTLEWSLPALTDETARYTPAGRLRDRQIAQGGAGVAPANPSSISYYYDPSGNMTNAVQTTAGTNSQSWTLAYDEDNRTTSIQWTSGTTNKLIANRYDALGRRFSRTVDGQTTRYVLDLSGSMERILCDLNPDGTTNWYVHGPDLCYRVDSSNNVACYHADAMANVISLTGVGGINLSLYAYTPYGRSLGATNLQFSSFSPQPFTFVGSQGVMEELPGLYFMRARYYSSEAGIFLSTDPVKKIGPRWKPTAYGYASANPGRFVDPRGAEGEPSFMLIDAINLNYKAANGSINGVDYASYVAGAATTIAIAGLAALSAPITPELVILATAVSAFGYAADWQDPGTLIGGPIRNSVIVAGSLVFSSVTTFPNYPLEPNSTPALLANGKSYMLNQLPSLYGSGNASQNIPNPYRLPSSQMSAANQAPSTRIAPTGTTANNATGTTSGGSSSGFLGSQSISSSTAGAGIFGGLMTAISKTQSAGPSINSVSTGGGLNLGGGGSLVPKTGGVTTPAYVPPSPPPINSTSCSTNPLVNAWNWLAGLFP